MAESLYDKHGTSDEFNDPYCDICYEAKDINVRPDGYCHECYQCLCKDCLVVHTRLLPAKDHIIRTGPDMPKSQEDKPPRFEHCPVHQPRWKDQYCNEHKGLLCSLCVPVNHKDCHVESVECAAKNIPSSEVDLLNNTVSDFKTQLSSAESRIQKDVSDLREQKNKILKEILEIYKKTVSKIIKVFQDIDSDLESKYQCQSSALLCDQKNIKDATLSLESTLDDISVLKGRIIDTKVFLKIQGILKNIDKCKIDVATLNQTTTRRVLNFVPDKTMNNFFSSFTLGTISLEESNHDVIISVPEIIFPSSPTKLSQNIAAGNQPSGNIKPISEIKAQKHTEYNIKLLDDKNDCWITGLSITLDGRRLLADGWNSKIKMFSRDMKIISSLSLPGQPWDIAITGDRKAVVSVVGKSKLFIIKISDKKMSIRRTVKLSFRVYGIETYEDRLVVTTTDPSPHSVKLIDHRGKVYWSTSTDHQGQLFSVPDYVTCSVDGRSSTVIVTDLSNDTLTLLNSDTGDVISKHKFGRKRPHGITTDTVGNIFVCYRGTWEVAVLSRDFSEKKILLTQRDGISTNPQAIVYDAEDHRLLVSYWSRDVVDCFQLL